jgi:hypothetical protein
LIGDKIGMYPVNNMLYTLRLDKETPPELISSGMECYKKLNN